MKNAMLFLAVLILFICGASISIAEMLFSDDFEGGLKNIWIFSERGGKDAWNVAKDGNNSVLKKTGNSWTIISVDGVAGVKSGKEVWATARIRCDVAAADEGTELGLLIDPANSTGNWYFTVRAITGQAGFDELGVAWHELIPYADWKVGVWFKVKVAVIGDIFYGKLWPDGQKEPADWTNKTTMTSHLDQDGVGFATDTNEVSFDDLIVGDSEDSLVLSVDPKEKLSVVWGKIKQ